MKINTLKLIDNYLKSNQNIYALSDECDTVSGSVSTTYGNCSLTSEDAECCAECCCDIYWLFEPCSSSGYTGCLSDAKCEVTTSYYLSNEHGDFTDARSTEDDPKIVRLSGMPTGSSNQCWTITKIFLEEPTDATLLEAGGSPVIPEVIDIFKANDLNIQPDKLCDWCCGCIFKISSCGFDSSLCSSDDTKCELGSYNFYTIQDLHEDIGIVTFSSVSELKTLSGQEINLNQCFEITELHDITDLGEEPLILNSNLSINKKYDKCDECCCPLYKLTPCTSFYCENYDGETNPANIEGDELCTDSSSAPTIYTRRDLSEKQSDKYYKFQSISGINDAASPFSYPVGQCFSITNLGFVINPSNYKKDIGSDTSGVFYSCDSCCCYGYWCSGDRDWEANGFTSEGYTPSSGSSSGWYYYHPTDGLTEPTTSGSS